MHLLTTNVEDGWDKGHPDQQAGTLHAVLPDARSHKNAKVGEYSR